MKMSKHIVLAGGGHAHMLLLANISNFIRAGHRVTVIQPSEHHYYSGMGPGMLSGFYKADDIRFQTKHVVEKQDGKFLHDKVVSINAPRNSLRLESGTDIDYDILSCNTGSHIPSEVLGNSSENIFNAKPIERLLLAKESITTLASQQDTIKIAVVGGGPAAIEIGGCAHQLCLDLGFKTVSLQLFCGLNLMKEFPQSVQKHVRNSFAKRNIQLIETGYVKNLEPNKLTLDDSQSHSFDIAFVATGVKPSLIFQKSGLPTGPDGGLRVNAHLQSIQHENILGGGDCIYHDPSPLNKVGVYAVRQNPVLLENIWALLNNKRLSVFNPGGRYLLIFNMGDQTGILHKSGFTLAGRIAFSIKNYIDKKFIKTYQQLEY
jgi:NADH dehydrogenase FAD-containing subunit